MRLFWGEDKFKVSKHLQTFRSSMIACWLNLEIYLEESQNCLLNIWTFLCSLNFHRRLFRWSIFFLLKLRYYLWSSRNFIGFWLYSRRVFIFRNFSSPNLDFRNSPMRIGLFGDEGVFGLKIVSAKENFLGSTFWFKWEIILLLWVCCCCYVGQCCRLLCRSFLINLGCSFWLKYWFYLFFVWIIGVKLSVD